MNSKIKYSDEILINKITNRNQKAFSILYDKYSNFIFGIILRIVDDKEIAENILQQVFLKVWEEFPNYSNSKQRLLSGLLDLTRTTANKYNSIKLPNDKKSINNKCPFELLDLMLIGGCSENQIAEKLNIPINEVRLRLREILNTQRKIKKINLLK